MRRIKCCAFLVVCVSVLVFGVTDGVCGDRDHQNGFFLRLALGAGPARSKISSGPQFVKFSGGGADMEIAIGGIVTPNLALHGTLFGWAINDPNGETHLGSGDVNGDLTMSALGIGLTYFFMPVNLYLSGSVGVGSLSGGGNIDGESDTGLALEAVAGKEWFVSKRWGLGVSVGFTYHSFPDGGVDENWKGWSIPIRFSATFN
ncbi:MAG: hypothetical protein P8181_14125 [bacterium]